MIYKPETVEENLANIIFIKNNFQIFIDSYIHQYNSIFSIFNNQINYNQALMYGFINNTTNFEMEVSKLAYSIFGFTNDVYHRVSYALDCWDRRSKNNSAGASFKRYYQNLKRLNKEGYITGKERQTLLGLRGQRNETAHYGRIKFITYIFNNRFEVYRLLNIAQELLESVIEINELKYKRYINSQFEFLEELDKTLKEYNYCIMNA